MDLRKLKKLIDLVQESGIAELEITEGEEKVKIVLGGSGPKEISYVLPQAAPPAQVVAAPAVAPAAAPPTASPSHLAAARELVVASGLSRAFGGIIPDLMVKINMNFGQTRPELAKDLKATLDQLQATSIDELIEARFKRVMTYGRYKETSPH